MSEAAGWGGAFLNGFLKGKATMEQQAMEKQRFEMEKKRYELDLAKSQDEASMREEMKLVTARPSLAKVTTVMTADGPVVYADAAMAKEHVERARMAGDEKVEMKESYSAAGKMYDDESEAKNALDAQHTPAAMARRKAEVAEKYFRPDVAALYQKNYQTEVESSRKDMKEAFFDAYRRNDIEGAADLFNSRLANGEDAVVTPGENGSFTITKTKGGKPIGQPQTFANATEFWNGNGTQENPGLLIKITEAPDNFAEMWKTREGLKLQGRQVASQERTADANVRKADADIANIPFENQIKATQASASATSAGAAVLNARTNQMGLTMPKIHSGVDATGDVSFGATQPVFDPATKQWGLKVIGPQSAPGMRPPPRGAGASGLDALLGGLAAPQAPLTVDWSKVPPKNVGGATSPRTDAQGRPLGQSASGLIKPYVAPK